jgi:hypothetical protein
MEILLPALGIAFVAIGVWLTVRIVNRKERWARWTLAVTLSLPVLYVIGFGPACWLASEEKLSPPVGRALCRFYSPLLKHVLLEVESWSVLALHWWSSVGSTEGDAYELSYYDE